MQITIKQTKTGQRAFRWSSKQMRYFPMKLAEAKLLISTGKAKQVTTLY